MKKYIIITVIILITIIILYFTFRKKIKAVSVPLTPDALEFGVLSDAEIETLAYSINENIEGITIFGEEQTLQSMLVLNSIDLVRLYNFYLESFNKSLYEDVFNEWYWSGNSDLVETLKQKFINLHINI